jgi:hypothetical protein
MIELVAARYLEDLAWLRNIPPQIRATVYDKNPEAPAPGAIQLPNVGREAHTYLHHIVTRYDTLAPLTIFVQGKPFDHVFDLRKTLRELVQAPHIDVFRWLGHIIDTDTSDGALFKTWSKNPEGGGIDIAGFHRVLFGVEGPEEYVFYLGAHFIVTSELVRSRPLEFYQRALQLSVEFPEGAHCFERTWDKVFGVQGIDLNWLNGRKTVYLKPVRKLTI